MPRLWDAISRCAGSISPTRWPRGRRIWRAWRHARDYLNDRRYTALHIRGPGTDLTIGLPDGHVWVSGHSISQSAFVFAPNLPTEEVFTIAHKDRVDGTVRSTKPLSYGGTLIEDFTLRFEQGRVVDVGGAAATSAPAAGGHRRGRGPARGGRARAAQLAGLAVGTAVLQHALRRERRQPRGARRRLQVHARGGETMGDEDVRGAPAATAASCTSTS